MKITRKLFLSAASGALLLALGIATVYAGTIATNPGSAPPGLFRCGGGRFSCRATLQSLGFPATTFSTTGIAGYNVTGNSGHTTQLAPDQWTGNGQDPALGRVQWSFDLSRAATTSTITSNGDAPYPATGDLYFYIVGTLGITPNITYQSKVELHLQSTGLTSFYPFINETFALVGTVDFEDVNRPGQTAFTLSNLVLTLDH